MGTFLIFTPIPLMSKKCDLSISLHVCVQWRIREWLTLTYTPFHSSIKFYMFLSLYITNYLIGLVFWAIPIGRMWLGVGLKGTNKTLTPMGFRLFSQLLTSPKLSLIIFNTTI